MAAATDAGLARPVLAKRWDVSATDLMSAVKAIPAEKLRAKAAELLAWLPPEEGDDAKRLADKLRVEATTMLCLANEIENRL
jgi:hypothetical protein